MYLHPIAVDVERVDAMDIHIVFADFRHVLVLLWQCTCKMPIIMRQLFCMPKPWTY